MEQNCPTEPSPESFISLILYTQWLWFPFSLFLKRVMLSSLWTQYSICQEQLLPFPSFSLSSPYTLFFPGNLSWLSPLQLSVSPTQHLSLCVIIVCLHVCISRWTMSSLKAGTTHILWITTSQHITASVYSEHISIHKWINDWINNSLWIVLFLRLENICHTPIRRLAYC